jgi:hypothetical protein
MSLSAPIGLTVIRTHGFYWDPGFNIGPYLRLAWASVDGATGYNVYQGLGDRALVNIGNAAGLEWIVGLNNPSLLTTVLNYSIQAYDGDGNSSSLGSVVPLMPLISDLPKANIMLSPDNKILISKSDSSLFFQDGLVLAGLLIADIVAAGAAPEFEGVTAEATLKALTACYIDQGFLLPTGILFALKSLASDYIAAAEEVPAWLIEALGPAKMFILHN